MEVVSTSAKGAGDFDYSRGTLDLICDSLRVNDAPDGTDLRLGWQYLAAHPEMIAAPARAAFPTGMRRALFGGSVYLVAIVVALISPALSFAIDALVAV